MITQDKKKLFLIDSYALIYRAYFAFIKNPRINSKGFDTSAIYGFLNTLTEIIREERPTHIATVFDLKGPTKRHVLYKDYKANRDAMPEGISLAIPYIKKVIDSLNIQRISLAGYEADDLIGTLSKMAEKEGLITYMVTPDKDFAQLVTKKIFIYKPGKRGDGPTIMGEDDVCDKYGLKGIYQFIDFLAMMGDASDNIPGIAGVGPKTAQRLIDEYESMDMLIGPSGDQCGTGANKYMFKIWSASVASNYDDRGFHSVAWFFHGDLLDHAGADTVKAAIQEY